MRYLLHTTTAEPLAFQGGMMENFSNLNFLFIFRHYSNFYSTPSTSSHSATNIDFGVILSANNEANAQAKGKKLKINPSSAPDRMIGFIFGTVSASIIHRAVRANCEISSSFYATLL